MLLHPTFLISRVVGLELATRGKAETLGEQVVEILFKLFHVSLPGNW
jgi:hypothetical protein